MIAIKWFVDKLMYVVHSLPFVYDLYVSLYQGG